MPIFVAAKLKHSTMKSKNLFFILSVALLGACSQDKNPKIIIETDLGNIEAEIFLKEAPITGANFMQHVDAGTYSNKACFYRVVRLDNQPDNDVKIEVIQGGLYDDETVDKIPAITHETTATSGVKHSDGSLSMARGKPGTASTEFFICIGNQPELDYGGKRNPDGQGFAVFGKVIKGMEVAKQIQLQKDSSQYLQKQISIQSIKRKE